ncbi:MAG: MBL fold metallo-hydrolase [Myxococcales bacterium]|nr:MBL fold metallo-hydrolase [Myxococcales bacterium]MDH3405213.1 MBL fold metallo-hydrolase [Acidobacteriota bacterium]
MLRARTAAATVGLLVLPASWLSATAAAGTDGFPPAPRDAEGRFENLAGPIERAGFGVTAPFGLRRIWGSLTGRDGAPEVVPNDGAFLRRNARHSVPTVTWVGHATLLIQMGGLTFLTDPTWSKTASPVAWFGPRRFVEPGLALEALPPIDFVVISHNHFDHLDLRTLERLARRGDGTHFLVPVGNGALLRSRGIEHVDELDWGEARTLSGVEVVCVPAQHWSRRGLRDERRALWASWVVAAADRRFYFGGDTGYFAGFADIGAKLGPFDLAAVPIGAYEPQAMMRPFHLDPEQAIQAARDLRAQRVVGVHFGTFDLSDEPLGEPPRRFRAAAEAAGFSESEAWILRIGETRAF